MVPGTLSADHPTAAFPPGRPLGSGLPPGDAGGTNREPYRCGRIPTGAGDFEGAGQ